MANQLWEDWQIDQVFNGHKITNSPISTPLIARVLTINRCLEPTSCYSIQDWVKTTALPQILNLDPDTLNDDKLYYELNKVEANKESLENFLFNKTYQLNSESYNYVNYDLTLKYISALDKNQIPKVEGVNLQLFKDLTVENIREEIESLPGFTKHDDPLYYQDLGQVKDKRYILGINPTLFIEGRSNREEKIELFSRFIHQLN